MCGTHMIRMGKTPMPRAAENFLEPKAPKMWAKMTTCRIAD